MSLSAEPIEILVSHNRWATRELLNACKAFGDQQLDRSFEIGRGSLRATLYHLIETMNVWTQRMMSCPLNLKNEPSGSILKLIDWHDEVSHQFAEIAQLDSAEKLSMPRKDKLLRASRGGIILHVVTHGMHHRAQALNMLRHVGVLPQPKSSLFEWLVETGAADPSH